MSSQQTVAHGLRIEVASGPEGLAACHDLRRRVFIEGQGVSEAEEMDGLDAEATHFLAHLGERPVGTARLRELPGAAKAERVAVVASARGRGVGRALMQALEREAARRGHGRVILNAQEEALRFYARLGYTVTGGRFHEAGIPHRAMEKAL